MLGLVLQPYQSLYSNRKMIYARQRCPLPEGSVVERWEVDHGSWDRIDPRTAASSERSPVEPKFNLTLLFLLLLLMPDLGQHQPIQRVVPQVLKGFPQNSE